MLVALLGCALSQDGSKETCDRHFDVVDMADPSTGIVRPYLVDGQGGNNHTLYEITAVKSTAKSTSSIDDSYQSFAVKMGGQQYIVQNGTLHTITPVDPLFWFLCDEHLPSNATKTNGVVDQRSTSEQQWQPMSQLVSHFDPTLVRCLSRQNHNDLSQLLHLYAEMSLGDDDKYVKFSVDKSCRWLELKQQSIEQVLYRHFELEKQRNLHNRTAKGQRGGGAFLSGFTVASSSKDVENEATVTNQAETAEAEMVSDSSMLKPNGPKRCEILAQQAKDASIQIVCNYLTPAWRLCFLQHLQLENASSVLENTSCSSSGKKRRSSLSLPSGSSQETAASTDSTTTTSSLSLPRPNVDAVDWNAITGVGTTAAASSQSTTTAASASLSAKTKSNPITAGAKKLLKANKKGLQKMSSFFGASKKAK